MLLISIFSILILTILVLFFIPSSDIKTRIILSAFSSIVVIILFLCLTSDFYDFHSRYQSQLRYHFVVPPLMEFSVSVEFFELSLTNIYTCFLIKYLTSAFFLAFILEKYFLTPTPDKDLIKRSVLILSLIDLLVFILCFTRNLW